MTESPTATCPKCKATVEAGAVFCTACGTRLPESRPASAANAPEPIVGAAAETKAPDPARCRNCQAVLEPGALFCTGCGTRTAAAGSNIAAQTAAAAPAAMAAAAQPAYEPTQAPASSYTPAALAPAPRKTGPFVIVILLLLIAVAGTVLWLRPSAPKPGKVLILTPESSSVTVEPNSTTQLGIAVQGDGGAGVAWKVQESYGGHVEPAGVTARGEQIIYKAAYHSGGTPGDYHIVATSAANKESQVAITVHVER